MLTGWLDYHRATLVWKCTGPTAAPSARAAARRSAPRTSRPGWPGDSRASRSACPARPRSTQAQTAPLPCGDPFTESARQATRFARRGGRGAGGHGRWRRGRACLPGQRPGIRTRRLCAFHAYQGVTMMFCTILIGSPATELVICTHSPDFGQAFRHECRVRKCRTAGLEARVATVTRRCGS